MGKLKRAVRRVVIVLPTLALVLAAGCGSYSKSSLVEVTGTLTWGGQKAPLDARVRLKSTGTRWEEELSWLELSSSETSFARRLSLPRGCEAIELMVAARGYEILTVTEPIQDDRCEFRGLRMKPLTPPVGVARKSAVPTVKRITPSHKIVPYRESESPLDELRRKNSGEV